MNFFKIKNLVKQNGDKFIFLENGEPEIVMMSFREYEKLFKRDPNLRVASGLSESYSGHSDIEFGSFGSPIGQDTEFIGPMAAESPGLPVHLEDIQLEDLPI